MIDLSVKEIIHRKEKTNVSLPSASAGEGFINIAKESAATAKALPTPSKESSCFAWSLVDLCAKESGSGAKALAPIAEEARNTLANETLMLVSFIDKCSNKKGYACYT